MLIIVKDVNDLPPKFEQSSYETTIYEEDDRHLPKTILQVHYLFCSLEFHYLIASSPLTIFVTT